MGRVVKEKGFFEHVFKKGEDTEVGRVFSVRKSPERDRWGGQRGDVRMWL